MNKQADKLKDRLNSKLKEAEELANLAGMPLDNMVNPPEAILNNLVEECEYHTFWLNFKKAAPMLFCAAVEHDPSIKSARDMSFMDELLKVRSMMSLMANRLGQGDAGIDIIEYSMAA